MAVCSLPRIQSNQSTRGPRIKGLDVCPTLPCMLERINLPSIGHCHGQIELPPGDVCCSCSVLRRVTSAYGTRVGTDIRIPSMQCIVLGAEGLCAKACLQASAFSCPSNWASPPPASVSVILGLSLGPRCLATGKLAFGNSRPAVCGSNSRTIFSFNNKAFLIFLFALGGPPRSFWPPPSKNSFFLNTAKSLLGRQTGKSTSDTWRGSPHQSLFVCMHPSRIKIVLASRSV